MDDAAIIIIGNEILSGRTIDANVNFIAENLSQIGVSLLEVRIIADDEQQIINAVNELRVKHDYVFTTGGIGPTHDDITAKSIAKAFNLEYAIRQEAYDILVKQYGQENLTEARLKMAKMPEKCNLIQNNSTQVPGFNIENVFVMAGVPNIMQSMFLWLVETGKIKKGQKFISETIDFPAPESKIAMLLANMQQKFPQLEIGSYPYHRGNIWGTEISIRGINNDQIQQAKKQIKIEIKEIL